MVGLLSLILIACLYSVGAAFFGFARNGPQALMCFGAVLILAGQIWQIIKSV